MVDGSNFAQIGIVVKDMDQAVKYYEEVLGVGPFTVRFESDTKEVYYYGEKTEQQLKIAMCQYGSMVIELIEVKGGNSVHLDFLKEKGEGVDHLGFVVKDLEKTLEECRKKGFEVIEYVPVGKLAKPGRGLAYIDADKIGGLKYEFIQVPEGDSLI
ncbi:MAG: VOC family protein [Eubacteriales bacterium]|nr:VOC family protein [Eubacteriales bacterium]